MRRISPLFSVLIALLTIISSCKSSKDLSVSECLDFLYKSMPLPDKAVYSEDFWRANVEKTLEVRDKMGWNIPEREFMHFVLPLRVNNESLDDFRTIYADTLCQRVKGMSLEEAVLEINHWCHEMATYKPSDGRTSSPLATIRYGLGRCGEESVLGLAALRAAGIPARQVYTPRWAHTDDNHAWIEAWVDGKWHFMGACEPEAKLDMAWFNAPVSRALLLHTKVYGDYHGDEDVISRNYAYTEINVTPNYVPIRRSVVTVVDTDGKPVEGASVEYKIYNYAEFFTVATYSSSKEGKVALNTGAGDMLAWASKGDKFGFAKISADNTEVVLDHIVGEEFSVDIDILPPAENPLPISATDEEIAACKVRFDMENEMREARPKGNDAVLEKFRKNHGDDPRNVEAILASLSFKDMNDVTIEVLEDSYSHISGTFEKYRDCPRVELEFLMPYFEKMSSVPVSTVKEAIDWVNANIEVDDSLNPQGLRIPPVGVLMTKVADSKSRDIFFVALCRAKGIRARLDEVTAKVQYLEGGEWIDVNFSGIPPKVYPQGTVSASYSPIPTNPDPLYYKHFSLSKIENGSQVLLSYDDSVDLPYSSLLKNGSSFDEGYYSLTTGSRMADGGALVHMEFFNVKEAMKTTLPLVMRFSETRISVIGSMDAEALFTKENGDRVSLLSETGRGYSIVATVGDKDEPTTHAVRQMGSVAKQLNDWGRKVVVLGKARPEGLTNMICGTDPDGSIFKMLTSGCSSTSRLQPVVTICDSFGRIVYFSQGYNTSLGEELKNVIDKL
ncbi:MAG: transglutaminase-like domain-containing protein [Bacteroidales bacterium]|nr:transglutaminase-like domain-containing protein [Bacteroidales bacterium]